MAARRRRKFTRKFAGSMQGRQLFWYRFTPFAVPLVEAASATHAEILIEESDWQNPSVVPNETRKGGPRLERMIVDYGLSINVGIPWFTPAGDAQLALIPEFMIWKQQDNFASLITSSVSFDSARNNNRVLMDEVPSGRREIQALTGAGVVRTVQGHYETKSKVRLAEGALGVAWRGFFDTGSENLFGYTDWIRPTLLISTP